MSNFIPTSYISIDNTGTLVLSAFKTTGGVATFPGGLTVSSLTTLNGDLLLAQALRVSKASLSSNTTLADNQVLEEVNATTGPLTITLPNAGTFAGILYIIKKIDNTANTVTVATQASQTIDGATTYVLTAQYESISLISNGSNWDLFGGGFIPDGTTITQSGGILSVATGGITNTQVSNTANIAITKISNGSANQLLSTNTAGTGNEWKTVSGTTNQITVTPGAGTLTFALPQSIATTSNVRFTTLFLGTPSSIAGQVAFQNASNSNSVGVVANLVTTSYSLNLPQLQGAANTTIVNDGSGNLSFALVSDANVSSSANIAITKLAFGTANQFLSTNTAGTADEWKTISGTANQITVTPGAGTFVLSLPQNIATNSTPSFSTLTAGALKIAGSTSGLITLDAIGAVTNYTLNFPLVQGTASTTLLNDGTGNLTWGTAGSSGAAVTRYANFVVGTASGSYTGSTTVFDLPWTYTADGTNLSVFYDGVQMVPSDDYAETSTTRVTFVSARIAGRKVAFRSIATSGSLSATTHQRENYVVGTALSNYTGSTTVFNFVLTYVADGKSLQVWNDGVLMTPGAGNDYLETSTTSITFNSARLSGSKITVSTDKVSITTQATSDVREDYVVGTASGNYTGSTSLFNLLSTYTVNGKNLSVYVDGVLMIVGSTNDYLETTSSSVTFNSALLTGQTVSFAFKVGSSALNATSVNGIAAQPSTSPAASQLVALDSNGKFPIGVIPSAIAVNYIATNDGSNTTGWATYNNGATASPTTGTGGTATTTLTSSVVTPLRGLNSFLMTRDANNRQGEGVSYDFTIDSADQARILQISFDYNQSGYVPSDLSVWIYDKTNAVLIPVAPNSLQGAGSNNFQFKGIFQTNPSSTSYRFIIHTATTTSVIGNLRFDNVYLGPQVIGYGAPVTDWTAFTPTGSWTTNTTYSGFYRRVGDSAEIFFNMALTGAPNSATLTLNLPSNLVIDTTKMQGPTNGATIGYGLMLRNGVASYSVISSYNTTTQIVIYFYTGSPAVQSPVNTTSPATWGSGDFGNYTIKVPILGWSSTVQMSNDTDTRVVAAKYNGSNNASVTVTPVIINSQTKEFDTHAAYSTTTGQYTVPVAGVYRVTASTIGNVNTTATPGSGTTIWLYKNGTALQIMNAVQAQLNNATSTPIVAGTCLVSCVVGDVIDARVSKDTNITAFTISTGSQNTYVCFERLNGPATIAATEVVTASYTGVPTSVISSSVFNTFILPTKDFDTHGAYNATTGIYTCPTNGYYRITAHAITAGSFTAGQATEMCSVKNTVQGHHIYELVQQAISGQNLCAQGTWLVSAVAGDQLSVAIICSATSPSYPGGGAGPYYGLSFEKLKN